MVVLFTYQPGALDIVGTELLGLTVPQAVALARARGTIDE
jgi:hypothetical protein